MLVYAFCTQLCDIEVHFGNDHQKNDSMLMSINREGGTILQEFERREYHNGGVLDQDSRSCLDDMHN